MKEAGINVEVFKSHSLRVATATHLLKAGCKKTWVKARGGCSSMATLDMYYDRLHQHQDWASMIQGKVMRPQEAMGEDATSSCYRQTASNADCPEKAAPPPKATKEAEGGGQQSKGKQH